MREIVHAWASRGGTTVATERERNAALTWLKVAGKTMNIGDRALCERILAS